MYFPLPSIWSTLISLPLSYLTSLIDQERIQNIIHMQNILNKFSSKKQELIPTHTSDPRRKKRTRSHKRYRVRKNKKKKLRIETRHTRRKYNVMKLQHLPSMETLKSGKAWLPTHKWHTKRFHMKSLWGYSLPSHSTSFGLRHVSHILKNSCALHDMSYLQPVELQGPLDDLLALLEHYTVRFPTWKSLLMPVGPSHRLVWSSSVEGRTGKRSLFLWIRYFPSKLPRSYPYSPAPWR